MIKSTAAPNAIDPAHSVLVLVDYQQRLMPAIHRGDEVLAEALRLADVARALGMRVVGTEQNPAGLGPNVESLRRRCDVTLAKTRFDACADGLIAALRPGATDPETAIVIAGCEAHVCLMQTALGLLRAGFSVRVVAPACGSRSAADHELAMQRLRQAGAVIVSVEMVAFELLRSSSHPGFKTVLQLIKARTSMNIGNFENLLKAEGYTEIETKQLASGTHNAAHDHPFDVHALVLGGDITLTVDGRARAYREGEVFTMAAGCRHVEDVGPEGVRYLVGRRRRAQGGP